MEFIYNNNVDNLVIEVFPDIVAAFYVSKAERKMTGYVWLFNIDHPEGAGELEPGTRNPDEKCYPHSIQMPIEQADFDVISNDANNSFGIYFRGKLVGILGSHDNPGKSSFARVDSPSARTMGEEIPRPS